jgi:feruloyl esterase
LSGDRCAALRGRQIAGARIDTSETVPAGRVMVPFKDPISKTFCKVLGRIATGPASQVKLQAYLPADWNGKFVGVGGGGFEGGYASAPFSLRGPVEAGYAGLATDAGHDPSPVPRWAIGAPEKVADFGHRANHLGAVVGKALVREFYGRPAKRAYFHGCSNGGRDALMLAQRYPADYDTIVAGAPAYDYTAIMAHFAHFQQLAQQPGAGLSPAKLNLVYDAAKSACDARDGLQDGLIEQPQLCRFDPAVLQCKQGGGDSCLSPREVETVRAIYRGTVTRDGRQVVAGLPVGSEYEWNAWLTGPKSTAGDMGLTFFATFVYGDENWNRAGFSLEREFAEARRRVGPAIDATDPDLRPFLRRGGKLLMYHGWDDAAIPAGSSLGYFDRMKRKSGRLAQKNTRLFMLPGVAHCTGGKGPSVVDYLAEADRWTESGKAPERIVASKTESAFRALAGLSTPVLSTRPVCAWPRAAHYKGQGSIDSVVSYVCR